MCSLSLARHSSGVLLWQMTALSFNDTIGFMMDLLPLGVLVSVNMVTLARPCLPKFLQPVLPLPN